MIKGLPDKLKDLRIKYGFSQKQVAELIDLSPSVVSGYETGERTPSTEKLLALSNLFQCSTDYLLGKDNKNTSFIDLDGLTDEQIRAVTNLVQSMRGN